MSQQSSTQGGIQLGRGEGKSFWLLTDHRNSMSNGPAGPPPLRAFCRGATHPRVNVMKTTRATSSSSNGPDTALHNVSTARASPRSTVRRATLNY